MQRDGILFVNVCMFVCVHTWICACCCDECHICNCLSIYGL